MKPNDLQMAYQAYIDCLNKQDWESLHHFVHEDVHHNGKMLGVSGYRAMLEHDYQQIPDLRFDIEMMVANTSHVAVRLKFNVTPKGEFLGLPVNGQKVTFYENAFYEIRGGKISRVWSIIDKGAIEMQIG